jgi:ribosome-associated toxin RatA of RatAB toxin-antitoxin module
MTKYDVTDEAVVSAEPGAVFSALLSEFAGTTNWWMPYFSGRLRQGDAVNQVDALIDQTVHGKRPINFTVKVVEVKKNEVFRVQYVEGAFRGEGLWRLEPTEGNTRVSFRWRTDPSGGLLFRIMARFFLPKAHSDVMKAGFAGLKKYLEEKGRA